MNLCKCCHRCYHILVFYHKQSLSSNQLCRPLQPNRFNHNPNSLVTTYEYIVIFPVVLTGSFMSCLVFFFPDFFSLLPDRISGLPISASKSRENYKIKYQHENIHASNRDLNPEPKNYTTKWQGFSKGFQNWVSKNTHLGELGVQFSFIRLHYTHTKYGY